jgi:peptide/nickel transport system substrate-binding protein
MDKSLIAFVMFLLFVPAGCARQAGSKDFVVAIESFPSNLDPRYPTDAYSSKVQGLLFNGLLKFDDQLMLVPDLADRYEYLSDTRIRFHLRSGIFFHNGKLLTTHDVLYTLKTLMDPAKKSPLYGTFKKIFELDAVDDQTIEIELREPFAPFLTALTVGIVPEGSDELSTQAFAERPIGTGPFAFVESRNDQWVRIKKFDNYFGGPPLLETVLIRTIRDDTTRVLSLLRGEVDLVQNAIPLVMAGWLKQRGQLEMESDVGINYAYLAFNLKDPQLQDRRLREAIALAIDRDRLIQYRLQGFAKKATGILAPSNWYYEPQVSEYPYDPEHAKQLLDEAGFKDPDGAGPLPRFTLQLKTSNKRDRIAMARAIAQDLKAVGIEVEVRPYEWGTFYRDIRTGNFQMYSSTWVGVTDPDIYYHAFYSKNVPPEGANRGYYDNPEVDQLLEKARAESDSATRKKYYSQVQKILSLDLPYVSLWYEDNVAFFKKDVADYRLRPDASLIGLVNTRVSKVQSSKFKEQETVGSLKFEH